MKRLLFVLTPALLVAAMLLQGCSSTTGTPTSSTKATTSESAPKAEIATKSESATKPTTATKSESPAKAASAPAKTYSWKLTSIFPPGHSGNRSITEFAKALEQRTNGAVKITPYEASLGNPADAWDMTKSNTVQFTLTNEAYNSARMPINGLLNLPFEVPNSKAAFRASNEMLKAGYLKELTDNFKVVLFWSTPPLSIFLRDKKVTTMDDLKGLKIRPATAVMGQTVTALGGTGVTMPGGEVYMGLDRGVIDGTVTGPDNALDRKLYEVSKYTIKEPAISFGVWVLLMNKETWNSLPPDLQATIDQISQEVSAAVQDKSYAEEQALWDDYGKKAEVYTLSKEEQAKWRAAVAGVSEQYVQQTAAKGYPAKEALELMRKVFKEYEK